MNIGTAPKKAPHTSVMLEEFLGLGFPKGGSVFIDGTFGFGGHTKALLKRFPNIKTCIGLDRDAEILNAPQIDVLDERILIFHANYSEFQRVLQELHIAKVDGMLLDLGVSSPQLDLAERGFSFSKLGPLDMRMDRSKGHPAVDILLHASQEELANIFFQYGEERFSRRIATAIVEKRRVAPLQTTTDLANIVLKAIPSRQSTKKGIHPATRVFQALRIAVNEELKELKTTLDNLLPCLQPGGRLSVISFHSLEDRIVKQFFAHEAKACICPPEFPVCTCDKHPRLSILTKKPICPSDEEMIANPRSRSAKLRIAERLPDPQEKTI